MYLLYSYRGSGGATALAACVLRATTKKSWQLFIIINYTVNTIRTSTFRHQLKTFYLIMRSLNMWLLSRRWCSLV